LRRDNIYAFSGAKPQMYDLSSDERKYLDDPSMRRQNIHTFPGKTHQILTSLSSNSDFSNAEILNKRSARRKKNHPDLK